MHVRTRRVSGSMPPSRFPLVSPRVRRGIQCALAAVVALALLGLLATLNEFVLWRQPAATPHRAKRCNRWGLLMPRCPAPDAVFAAHGLQWPEYLRGWLQFAESHGCALDHGYDTIATDLAPFAGHRYSRRELAAAVADMRYLNFCSVRSGRVRCQYSLRKQARVYRADAGFESFARHLPDMDFLLNAEDSPRVLTRGAHAAAPPRVFEQGLDTTLLARCGNVSAVAAGDGLHTMSVRRQPDRTDRLLPVLSPSRVEGCHLDIVMPTWWSRAYSMSLPPWDPMPYTRWEDKVDEVKWKGRTSGADIEPGGLWPQSQRFRLVRDLNKGHYFGTKVAANASFVGVVQCTGDAAFCDSICDSYRCTTADAAVHQFQAKYILDIDGNAWSERFEKLLLSGSVVLKATLHKTWVEERATPWVHYVPIDVSYANLNSTVQWLHTHQDEARRIGQAGRELALTRLRDIDMDCYNYRVLVEYRHRLLQH